MAAAFADDRHTLPLGAFCWAAAQGSGFTPPGLLDIFKRRGRYHPEDFARLKLTGAVDLPALKAQWLQALADAEAFVRSRPPSEVGCLYYSPGRKRFVAPGPDAARGRMSRP